ncbi:hypothetical protein JRQ81_007639 [Phrynocephalus forsythii]|uniref:Protein DGCR6 n=1 Tax=Phrynocephalus forsythii TaxID=171643 RepID=A0A9Q0XCG7_9SAUR|nr:hypothetical protein JRQ81_007639 [Phrynocephalus forsythii]
MLRSPLSTAPPRLRKSGGPGLRSQGFPACSRRRSRWRSSLPPAPRSARGLAGRGPRRRPRLRPLARHAALPVGLRLRRDRGCARGGRPRRRKRLARHRRPAGPATGAPLPAPVRAPGPRQGLAQVGRRPAGDAASLVASRPAEQLQPVARSVARGGASRGRGAVYQGSSSQQRLSYTILSDLALALLDGTVFEIVQGLLEIQHLTERNLYNQRLKLQNEHRALKQEILHKHREALQSCRPHNLPLLKAAQQRELEAMEQRIHEEQQMMDKKIVLELDQKVMDQQSTLEKAGVSGFYITTNPQELTLQMNLLDLIQKLQQKALQPRKPFC